MNESYKGVPVGVRLLGVAAKSGSYIKKDKSVANQYKAVTHDAVIAQVRSDLIERGILIIPELKRDQWLDQLNKNLEGMAFPLGNRVYSAVYDVHFVCAWDPANRITATVSGAGEDNNDKHTGKAISYAVKYAILKVLMSETGENEEGRQEQYRRISKMQIKDIETALAGNQAATEILLLGFEIDSLAEIPRDQFTRVLNSIPRAIERAKAIGGAA